MIAATPHFENFIKEVRTLDINVVDGKLDISNYRNKARYRDKLRDLSEQAIDEARKIIELQPSVVKAILQGAQEKLKDFQRIIPACEQLLLDCLNNKLNSAKLEIDVLHFFIVPSRLTGAITEQFTRDIYEPIVAKESALTGFVGNINKMQQVLPVQPVEKPVVKRRDILAAAYKENGGGLETEQIHAIADKHNFSRKALTNFYQEIKDDLRHLK